MKYEFRQGVRIPAGLTPDQAATELERIRNNEGLTPSAVVEASRPEGSPLHHCFEWADSRAAELYRESQARTLIRAVIVVEENNTAPVYYHIQEPEQPPRYEHISVLVKRPDLFEDALRRLKGELTAAARSVNELQQFAPSTKAKSVKRLSGAIAKAQEVAANM